MSQPSTPYVVTQTITQAQMDALKAELQAGHGLNFIGTDAAFTVSAHGATVGGGFDPATGHLTLTITHKSFPASLKSDQAIYQAIQGQIDSALA